MIFAISTVLAIAGYASAVVKISMSRGPPSTLSKRSITSSLGNNVTGGSYYVQVNIGTPGQLQTLALDTGSSDVWMLSQTADLCTDSLLQEQAGTGCGSTFDSSKSSTFKDLLSNEFSIQFLDESGAAGDYVSDNLEVGGTTIKALEMGLAFNATLGTGLMGIGYTVNEASNNPDSDFASFTYPSIIDSMVEQGLISRRAYSLYLDDLQASTGSIIFGGLDADKFHGSLLELPVVPTKLRNGSSIFSSLEVAMTGFGITGQQGTTMNLTSSSFKEVVVLDSGTTITYLPQTLVTQIYQSIGAVDDTNSRSGTGLVYVDCNLVTQSPKLTFNYGFPGTTGQTGLNIEVPVSELVFPLQDLFDIPVDEIPTLPFSDPCGFGIFSGGTQGPFILGDTFLRSAFVVYDLQSNVIAIAQTNFNSTQSNVVEFTATETGIPNVSGVASSVDVTASPTAVLPGPVGGVKTSGSTTRSATGAVTSESPTTAASSSSAASTSKSAGVAMIPAFNRWSLAVSGFVGALAALGGGWLAS